MKKYSNLPSTFDQFPAHIIAGMSEAERKYYAATLDKPRLGTEYPTALRIAEVRSFDGADVVRGYFASEARGFLMQFEQMHWNAEPTKGSHTESRKIDRVRIFYPNLFKRLRARLLPLLEVPALSKFRSAYDAIDADYYEGLASAEFLAKRLEGATKTKMLHDNYRLAYANIRTPL